MDCRKTTAQRTALRVAATAATLIVAGTASAQRDPVNSNLPPGALPSSWDPTYNVCRGVDPKCYNNWVGNRQDKVLIFSRTSGPRHAHIGTALPAGKQTQASATATPSTNITLAANNVAQANLRAWLNAEGIAVDITEDVSQLSGLSSYKAIIFLSTSRDALTKHGTAVSTSVGVNTTNNAQIDSAKTEIRKYMKAGGAFVAIHNAFGTEYNWPYYEGMLGNANFYDHGANQNGTVRMRGSADPSTAGLPATWAFKDEWYAMSPYPTNVKFLATVESLATPAASNGHPGHGAFHPVAWCQYYDGGRAWLTTLGHDNNSWIDGSSFAGQPEFKKLVVQGIKSAMGLTEFCKK